MVEQCAALRAAGLDVGLIFSRIQGLRSFKSDRALRGLPGFVKLDLPIPAFGFKSWNVPGMNALLPRLAMVMLRNRFAAYVKARGRPDILHAHVALESGPAARKIAAEFGLRYVVTEHSTAILNGGQTGTQLAVARAVYRDAHCVIAVSKVLSDRILDICPDANVRVIANVVRDSVFSLRKPNRNMLDGIIVVSIGVLASHKRFDDAIMALSQLPIDMKGRIEHRIIGDGPERARLEALAARGGVRTKFYGNLTHVEAMRALADARLFLHPSSYETFGVVLAEAMALGVPVVTTLCGGPETFVTPETGKLVPVGDIEALRIAVQDVLDHPDLWTGRAGTIAQYAHDHFHESSVTSAIRKTYQ
ncbi:hypothetical protein SPYCW_1649 [Sphingopyxis sp. EG6]|nr:hypothetical protein SPYCW_1649 [Sphingopyxis sp. EG6]